MLTAAHELYKGAPQRTSRLTYHIGVLMAREHLAAEDADTAHRLLESVAGAQPCHHGCLTAVLGRPHLTRDPLKPAASPTNPDESQRRTQHWKLVQILAETGLLKAGLCLKNLEQKL